MCIFYDFIVYLCTMIGYSGYVDENGNYDLSLYCEWFEEHLHNFHLNDSNERVYEGLSLEAFVIRHNNSIVDFIEELKELIADEELSAIEEEIKTKLKIALDMPNFFLLSIFVNELVREHYVVLLKRPTKNAIADLSEIAEITFTDNKGESVTTNCIKLIRAIMSAIKEPLDSEGGIMEVEKFDRYDKMPDVVEASVLQSKFAFYLAIFLKKAFPNADRSHRGKQGIISPVEQKLILRMMSYFGLAPKGYTLSTDRFRKLMESYNRLNFPIEYAQMPKIGLMPITYIKYEDWKEKIDWFSPDLKLKRIKKGDIVHFTKK